MRTLIFLSLLCPFSLSLAHAPTETRYHATFSKLGEGKVTQYTDRQIHHHIRSDDLPSKLALFEETLPPKSLGAPPHKHRNEDEVFIVIKGKVHFLDGDREVIAESGTIAALPRDQFHGFWNPYDQPATLLVLVTPGHFDGFFEAVEAEVAKLAEPDFEQINRIIAEQAEKMQVTLDMSRLPASARALLPPSS